MACFKYLFTCSLFLIDQLSSFEMCAIRCSFEMCAIRCSFEMCAIKCSFEMCAIKCSFEMCAIRCSFEMCAIRCSVSLFNLLPSYKRRSTVRLPLAQGHSGDSIIFNQCRHGLVFPWAVTIAVKLGVKLIFIFSLSLMFGWAG